MLRKGVNTEMSGVVFLDDLLLSLEMISLGNSLSCRHFEAIGKKFRAYLISLIIKSTAEGSVPKHSLETDFQMNNSGPDDLPRSFYEDVRSARSDLIPFLGNSS